MIYAITHLTNYEYSEPVNDSVMELRLQPRSDEYQRCVRFSLDISPDAKCINHRDYLNNQIHTFDIPAPHKRLAIKSEAVVEVKAREVIPDSLPETAWNIIDHQTGEDRDFYDMLLPGVLARETPLLELFQREVDWRRRANPLTLLRELNSAIYNGFEYQQNVTKVDSPIDVALEARSGVCQDFTHIMIAMARKAGIPARYVSGYLYHREGANDRSVNDASHAWMEAWLPGFGWVGFDPTNDLIVSRRHIRVSVSNDYTGASPTRGVFKGKAETSLDVRVKVIRLEELPVEEVNLTPDIVMPRYDYYTQEQQMQQQ